jgi:hypothetical protein
VILAHGYEQDKVTFYVRILGINYSEFSQKKPNITWITYFKIIYLLDADKIPHVLKFCP